MQAPSHKLLLHQEPFGAVSSCCLNNTFSFEFKGTVFELTHQDFYQITDTLFAKDIYGLLSEMTLNMQKYALSGFRRFFIRAQPVELDHVKNLLIQSRLMLEVNNILTE